MLNLIESNERFRSYCLLANLFWWSCHRFYGYRVRVVMYQRFLDGWVMRESSWTAGIVECFSLRSFSNNTPVIVISVYWTVLSGNIYLFAWIIVCCWNWLCNQLFVASWYKLIFTRVWCKWSSVCCKKCVVFCAFAIVLSLCVSLRLCCLHALSSVIGLWFRE